MHISKLRLLLNIISNYINHMHLSAHTSSCPPTTPSSQSISIVASRFKRHNNIIHRNHILHTRRTTEHNTKHIQSSTLHRLESPRVRIPSPNTRNRAASAHTPKRVLIRIYDLYCTSTTIGTCGLIEPVVNGDTVIRAYADVQRLAQSKTAGAVVAAWGEGGSEGVIVERLLARNGFTWADN